MSAASLTEIKRAQAQDLTSVLQLLQRVNLPTKGVAEHFGHFFVARAETQIVGCIGEERYGETSLLRSLAVAPEWQGKGLGRALTEQLLTEAKAAGVQKIVLLTNTAAEFFAREFGFALAARQQFDAAFNASSEWCLPRCSSAVCLCLPIAQS